MKSKTRSIGGKLDRVKSYQNQQKILSDWVDNWKSDQENVISTLRLAAQNDDHSEIMHMISQLEGLTEKRFGALNNVLFKLSDPDRRLLDIRETEEKKKGIEKSFSSDKIFESGKSPEILKREKVVSTEPSVIIGEIVKSYNANMSLSEIAKWSKINTHKVVKILVTAGVYSSETYDKVKDMREYGKTEQEIAEKLGLSRAAMNDYTPYKKGLYNSENPTENALKIRKCRGKI